ncbi:hypothetical protein [Psychrobacillus psychrodurans]|nr:hypothetical protein [Psychrobacillus psychrodurans]
MPILLIEYEIKGGTEMKHPLSLPEQLPETTEELLKLILQTILA